MNMNTEYRIVREVSLDEVVLIAEKSGMIYYGANTPWWTCSSHDLYKTPKYEGYHLPCDPRGGMLFQTEKVKDFFKAATSNVDHYGTHRLRTFLLAYHNCVHVMTTDRGWRPTCLDTWKDYDDLISKTWSAVQ